MRPELWPYLLGVFQPGATAEERSRVHGTLAATYYNLLHACEELTWELQQSLAARRAAARFPGLIWSCWYGMI